MAGNLLLRCPIWGSMSSILKVWLMPYVLDENPKRLVNVCDKTIADLLVQRFAIMYAIVDRFHESPAYLVQHSMYAFPGQMMTEMQNPAAASQDKGDEGKRWTTSQILVWMDCFTISRRYSWKRSHPLVESFELDYRKVEEYKFDILRN